jgi:hypothetical protein|tara:strand:- start:447 stop:890 length:444 start_codon:yes stop_codon:yes gene_type:complete
MALTKQQQNIISQIPPTVVITAPMRLTPVQKMLLDNSSTPDLMAEAITEGVFYAEVIESTSGILNPGAVGYGNKVMPLLYATLAEAQYENLSNIELAEKSRNRRDVDAGWKGAVVKVLWDGGNDFVVADIDTNKSIASIDWREACGL